MIADQVTAEPVVPKPFATERLVRAVAPVLVGAAIWLVPCPEGVAIRAWHLLAVFVATIVGLIAQPLPMGAMVLVGITATIYTGALTTAEALSGYANATVWLIVAAFLFARAFSKTGLGRRIAYWFIRAFGRRTLGLGYAMVLSDLVLAPTIPSGTARSGGVLFPIVRGLAGTYNSEPGPTAGRIGRFLMLNSYHAHVTTCAMFMTSMAANPLIAELTKRTVGIELTWVGWAQAAIVPGLIALLVMPAVLYFLSKPEITETPEAEALARTELAKMGRMRREELVVLGAFFLALALWITGSMTKIDASAVALLGVSIMVGAGCIGWDDVLGERAGWDALIWFGGLMSMASMLGHLGLLKWFSVFVGGYVHGWPWIPALGVLLLIYMYSQYAFAGLTAHVSAMFVPFLTVAVAAGAPPLLAALTLGFMSSLCVCLTHYGGGPAPVYFGSGYIELRTWWKYGLLVSVIEMAVWLGIGPFYWKALGLF